MTSTEFNSLSNTLKWNYILKNVELAICLIGIVGNFFTFFVLSRRHFANFSFPFYAKAMAITDSLVLLMAINEWSAIILNLDLSITSSIFCNLVVYLAITFTGISLCLVSTIAFDRLLTIVYPIYTTKIKKLSFKATLVVVIVVANFIIYVPLPLNYTLVEYKTSNTTSIRRCEIPSVSSASFISWLILGNIFVVSFVINNVLTGMLIYALMRSWNRLSITSTERRNRDRKFAMTSITLNIACFIFKFSKCPFLY
jgi:hypothetical protein